MNLKKIMFVFGTRPEAIKLAPVILKFLPEKKYETIICITGQHREILKDILRIFKIKFDYNLNIMTEDQTLDYVVIECLEKVKRILLKEKPDLIIVQGDTSTAFASALAGYYQKMPIAHIEAGLRSYRKYAPFPEEFNRTAIDIISDILFPPTQLAKENLLGSYRVSGARIFVTGNTVVDAINYISRNCIKYTSKKIFDFVKNLQGLNQKIILVTTHRRENFGNPLINISKALLEIVKKYKNLSIIFPAHPNPNVQKIVKQYLRNKENIHIFLPLNYIDFAYLMINSFLILTDSGGIQEEAATLKIPTLVLREVTERPEGVMAGILKIVGANKNLILKEISELIQDEGKYRKILDSKNPYGDGKASLRIFEYLNYYFGFNEKLPEEVK